MKAVEQAVELIVLLLDLASPVMTTMWIVVVFFPSPGEFVILLLLPCLVSMKLFPSTAPAAAVAAAAAADMGYMSAAAVDIAATAVVAAVDIAAADMGYMSAAAVDIAATAVAAAVDIAATAVAAAVDIAAADMCYMSATAVAADRR